MVIEENHCVAIEPALTDDTERGCSQVDDWLNKRDGFEKTLRNDEVISAGSRGMRVKKGIEVVLQRELNSVQFVFILHIQEYCRHQKAFSDVSAVA